MLDAVSRAMAPAAATPVRAAPQNEFQQLRASIPADWPRDPRIVEMAVAAAQQSSSVRAQSNTAHVNITRTIGQMSSSIGRMNSMMDEHQERHRAHVAARAAERKLAEQAETAEDEMNRLLTAQIGQHVRQHCNNVSTHNLNAMMLESALPPTWEQAIADNAPERKYPAEALQSPRAQKLPKTSKIPKAKTSDRPTTN